MQKRLPSWVINKCSHNSDVLNLKASLRKQNLNTVCESARCPNQAKCFSQKRVTFLIMGSRCTRCCRFCAVEKGKPFALDEKEPSKIADFCSRLDLKHAVITSVTRDDLPDGGAAHFAKAICAIKKHCPKIMIEALTPDFQGNPRALDKVLQAAPDVWSHNMETVRELYFAVRTRADYYRSLNILSWIKNHSDNIYTKSGFMLGLGEKQEQIIRLMQDLRRVDCDFLTIGQYLQPTRTSLPVTEYVLPKKFEEYKQTAYQMGFKDVMSKPLARTSYHSALQFEHAEKTAIG